MEKYSMNPVKLKRVILDIGIKECARRCGWSIGTQSRIENGEAHRDDQKMKKLNEVLGIDFSNFVKAGNEHV